MSKLCVINAFLFGSILVTQASLPTDKADNFLNDDASPPDCRTNSLETSIYCRGSRAIHNIISNLNKSEKPVVLVRGLEIVPAKDQRDLSTGAKSNDSEDGSFLELFSTYLRTHELNVKFSDLMQEKSEPLVMARDLDQNGLNFGSTGAEEARKKDKGQGLILAMAVVFAKILAVLGIGGIGALALKALGTAMMALMMAGIIGLKSLSQQGHESGHSVQYLNADAHHHKRRRRRSAVDSVKRNEGFNPLPLAYKGWQRDAETF